MNPFGMWYVFATAKEREEFHDAMNEAWRNANKFVVIPTALAVVLAAALII